MEYKYKCNECGHQFNMKSYNKSCQKCNSLNIDFTINHSDKANRKKKYLLIFLLLIILVTTGYLLKDIDFGKVVGDTDEIENSSIKYTAIYHELENGNCVSFKLITEEYDTVPYNSDNHSFFNLTFANITGSDIYNLDNNKLYPCEEGVRYTWNYDTTFMSGQTLISKSRYVTPEEFESFIISENAICKEIFKITLVEDPNLDNDCRLFVYTNHPDNLIDSSQIDTIGYTYFTKGSNLIEISLTGKEGVYLKQNEFDWDSSITHMNVWARSSQYPDEYVSYINNGMKFEECFLLLSINEEDVVTNNDNSDNNSSENRSEQLKKFKEEQTLIIKNAIKDPSSNEETINSYKAIWKLNGQDITENTYMYLDMEISNGKTLSITDIQVSRKGKQVNLITIKSR